ncbi:hypothetical protein NVP1063O_222 [Vibrio phage 1.063.O._10N.261.45.C7]|nr:hypothetical protein NVP1063O_222 [Vibrio phage 1.063.O._10N.261.45.C7]
MLTVKVYRNSNEDGLSLDKTRTISALEVETGYHAPEGKFSNHYVLVTDYKGTVHSFDLNEGTRIYVENLAGKTVQVYQYSESLK